MDRWPFHTHKGQRGTFMRITAETWIAVASQVLQIERASFIPSIRETEQALLRVVRSSTAVALAAFAGSSDHLVGYSMGDRLEGFDGIPGVKLDPHFGRRSTLYVSSVAVAPRWRARGFAISLERELIGVGRREGYRRFTAHIRRSAQLAPFLAKTILGSYSNWYATGEQFDYVRLDDGGD